MSTCRGVPPQSRVIWPLYARVPVGVNASCSTCSWPAAKRNGIDGGLTRRNAPPVRRTLCTVPATLPTLATTKVASVAALVGLRPKSMMPPVGTGIGGPPGSE